MTQPTLLRCSLCGGPVASDAKVCPHCGYGSKQAAGRTTTGAVVLMLAGAMIAIGSFLPWVTVTLIVSVSRSGLDGGGDGLITLVAGVLVAIVGVAAWGGSGPSWWHRLVAVAGGFVALRIAFYDGADVSNRLAVTSVGSIGVGLFVIGIGGAIAILTGLLTPGREPTHQASPS